MEGPQKVPLFVLRL